MASSHRILVLCVCAALLGAESVHREVLPSGLTVILQEHHLTPVVAVRLSVRCGPTSEGSLLGSGASLLLARILSTSGSTATPVADVMHTIGRLGDRFRVETAPGRTSFAIETTGEGLAEALALLAGMTSNYQYVEGDLERERDLVDAAPVVAGPMLADGLLYRTLFRIHPARLPAEGTQRMREQVTLDILKRYQAARYTAGNTTITVVGNISIRAARVLVEQSFSRYAVGGYQTPPPISEPVQMAARFIDGAQAPGQEPLLTVAWRVDGLDQPGFSQTALIARLLGDAVLPRTFAAAGIAPVPTVELRTPADLPAVLVVRTPAPDRRGERERAIYAAVESLLTEGPKLEELATAKRSLRLGDAGRGVMAALRAEDLDRWDTAVGDPTFGATVAAQIQAVSAEELQRLGRRMLGEPAQRACVVFLREEDGGPDPIAPPPTAMSAVAPEVVVLGSGVRVAAQSLAEAGSVRLHLAFGGGRAAEDASTPGVAVVLAEILRRRLPSALAPSVTVGPASLDIACTCLPDEIEGALVAISTAMRDTPLADDELASLVATLASTPEESPALRVRMLIAARALALAGDPVAREPVRHDRLVRIDRDALDAYRSRFLVGTNAVLGIVGRCDPAAVILSAGRALGGETLPVGEAWIAPAVVPAPSVAVNVVFHGGTGAGITLAWPAPGLRDAVDDEAPLAVLAALCAGGGRSGGRVGRALSAPGEQVVILAEHERLPRRGMFTLSGPCTSESADARIAVVREQIAGLLGALGREDSDPLALSQAELGEARAIALTAAALRREDLALVVADRAAALLAGRPLSAEADLRSRLQAVSRADLRRVAQAWLANDPVVVVARPRATEPAASADFPPNPQTRE